MPPFPNTKLPSSNNPGSTPSSQPVSIEEPNTPQPSTSTAALSVEEGTMVPETGLGLPPSAPATDEGSLCEMPSTSSELGGEPVQDWCVLYPESPDDTSYLSKETEGLTDRFLELLTTGKYSDVTLVVGTEKIKTHKVILIGSSPYFERLLVQNPGNEFVIDEEVDPGAFRLFIEFLYTRVHPTKVEDALGLIDCATKFNLPCLANAANKLLDSGISLTSSLKVLEQSIKYRRVDLQEIALDFICKNAYKMLDLEDFYNLSPSALELIIGRDDLRAYNEIQVCEAVSRWATSLDWKSDSEYPISPELIKRYKKQIRFPQMSKLEFTRQCQWQNFLEPGEAFNILQCFDLPIEKRSEFKSPFEAKPRDYFIPLGPVQYTKLLERTVNYELVQPKNALTFYITKPIWITSVNLAPWYYSHKKILVKAKLKAIDVDSNVSTILAMTKKEETTVENKCPNIKFNRPVKLLPHQRYKISVSIRVLHNQDYKAQYVYKCNLVGNGQHTFRKGDDTVYIEFHSRCKGSQIPEIGFILDEEGPALAPPEQNKPQTSKSRSSTELTRHFARNLPLSQNLQDNKAIGVLYSFSKTRHLVVSHLDAIGRGKILTYLKTHVDNFKPYDGIPEIGEIVVVLAPRNPRYTVSRGIVAKILDGNTSVVIEFIDGGGSRAINISDLRFLDEDLVKIPLYGAIVNTFSKESLNISTRYSHGEDSNSNIRFFPRHLDKPYEYYGIGISLESNPNPIVLI